MRTAMHIPVEKLPPDLREKIIGYLQMDNFQAAKRLRDEYETYLQKSTQQKMAKGIKSKATQKSAKEQKILAYFD